jgi:hypothetical protein
MIESLDKSRVRNTILSKQTIYLILGIIALITVIILIGS